MATLYSDSVATAADCQKLILAGKRNGASGKANGVGNTELLVGPGFTG